MDLACHYAGVAGAAEVAERQATHTGDVVRYVQDVCTRYDAFRGAISGLGGVYATAVTSACDGLDRSTRAAQRWGGAARDTADDLAGVDALARRVVEKLADLFPGLPDDLLPVAPVAPVVVTGACVPSSVPAALADPGGSPVPLDRVLGLDPKFSEVVGDLVDRPTPAADGDAPTDDGPADPDGEAVDTTDDHAPWRRGPAGPYGESLGAGYDLWDAAGDAADAVDALGDAMRDGADAQDDTASYDDFVARSGGAS